MAAAVAIGSVFAKFHLPIPYLMAGMIVSIICKVSFHNEETSWPKIYREYALYVAGYGIGAKFTHDAWVNIVSQAVGVAASNILILSVSVFLAFWSHKLIKEDLKSCIMGMLPGGLTIAMLTCEEDEECNPNIIMVMQVIRLFGVLFMVPFMVLMLFDAQAEQQGMMVVGKGAIHWLSFLVLSPTGYYICKKIHFPVPRLLGPILIAALVSVSCGGVQAPPGWLMMFTQGSIGLFIGTQVDPARMLKAKKAIPCVLAGTIVMLGISFSMARLLSGYYHFDMITAFLAMAPGGAAEMALAGLSMGADVSIILAYQIVRILTLNFVIPTLVWFMDKRKAAVR